MNLLETYPEEISLDGRTIRLDMDFRNVLEVLEIQDRQDLTPNDKIEAQCAWLLADGERLPRKAAEQAQIVTAAFALIPKPEKTGEAAERAIDFKQDAAMIRTAFFRIGIDLTRDRLHINQFLELLADLPTDTALMRTVEIRLKPLPKPNKHNAEQIAALQKAKARCAIRYSEEERRDRFMQSLKNTPF